MQCYNVKWSFYVDQSREITFALRPLAASLLIVSAAMLTACGGSSSSDNPHEHTDIDTAGRLALFDTDASQLKVLDLDNSEVLASMAMDGEAPRLYASPGNRYAVAIQRGEDLVSFVDGGLYTEDHGDHMHGLCRDAEHAVPDPERSQADALFRR